MHSLNKVTASHLSRFRVSTLSVVFVLSNMQNVLLSCSYIHSALSAAWSQQTSLAAPLGGDRTRRSHLINYVSVGISVWSFQPFDYGRGNETLCTGAKPDSTGPMVAEAAANLQQVGAQSGDEIWAQVEFKPRIPRQTLTQCL